MKDKIERCREIIITFYSFLSCSFSSRSVLGITLLNLLPAMTYGCSTATSGQVAGETVCTDISLTKSPDTGIETLDIFVFRDDRTGLLDCYQRVEEFEKWNRGVMSSSGERVICILANSGTGKYEWPLIRSRHSLEQISFNLEDECKERPVMTGEAKVYAYGGKDPASASEAAAITMKPLTCEIVLRSLRCDFKGRPYEGEAITDVKVYLTNVNAECRLANRGNAMPERIINTGFLNRHELSQFRDSSLIISHIGKSISKETIYPDIRLYCYPNSSSEESPGTPYTRLVIEGKVSGETYYWPININSRQGNGISCGGSYVFDVEITRKGTTDPDIPAEPKKVKINFKEEAWEEKDGYTVDF